MYYLTSHLHRKCHHLHHETITHPCPSSLTLHDGTVTCSRKPRIRIVYYTGQPLCANCYVRGLVQIREDCDEEEERLAEEVVRCLLERVAGDDVGVEGRVRGVERWFEGRKGRLEGKRGRLRRGLEGW